MTENARGAVPAEMDGLPTGEAAESIVSREPSLDPAEVEETLAYVAADGVVCREGIEAGLETVSGIIATPEERVDLARREFGTAVKLAEPVADLAVVASRLEGFEERLLALKQEVDRLEPELNELFNEWLEEPDDVYAMADGLDQHATRGRRMAKLVDELVADLESFQEWVTDASVRFDELEGDIGGVEESLADLAGALDDLDAETESAADGEDGSEEPEPAFVWVDAALRHGLVGLLVDDLETELGGLRAWADREGSDGVDRADDLAGRIEDVRERWDALGTRIESAARPAWRERFGDRLAAFESDLDAFDPPIDWGEVQATLEEHQAGIVPET